MVDKFSKSTRSYIMSQIRGKNTKPEILLRKALFAKGLRYKTHYELKGTPDIVFPKQKVAIFVDGCFWHVCPKHFKRPKTNLAYWIPHLKRNVKYAKEVNKELKSKGWRVLRLWEHSVAAAEMDTYVEKIARIVK